jgi:hypothetical protein
MSTELRSFAPGGIETEVTDHHRLYQLEVTASADLGEVTTSEVTLDDPESELDLLGLQAFRIDESAATGSNTVIWSGSMAERRYIRGVYRTDLGRQVKVSLKDMNTMLSDRVLRGSGADRPAETDNARINWLIASSGALPLIGDTRFVTSSNAVQMDAAKYRGMRAFDVLRDCAEQSGKNFFVWWADDVDEYSLWYDHATSANYASPLRLTNDLATIDNAWTFAISQDTQLLRDPSRMNRGVYLEWDGGVTYRDNDDVIATVPNRDATTSAPFVKTVAQAEIRAARELDDMDSEEDEITTTVILPAAKVNFLMQGMSVPFQAVHLPGYVDFVTCRVLTRTVRFLSEEDGGLYALDLKLSPPEPPTPTPPAPTPEAAFAVLYRPVNTHTGAFNRSDDVVYSNTGDAPPGGFPYVPKFGAVEYVSSVYASGTFYDGFEVTGTGTLDVYAKVDGVEVYAAGARTATITINKNGSPVATASDTTILGSGTGWSWSVITSASGVAVAPGDILSVHYSGDLSLSGRWPKIPAGTGSVDLIFQVDGSLA